MSPVFLRYRTNKESLKSNAEKEYNLGKNYTEWTRVGYLILNETFIVLKRAQNGMESRRIFKALTIGERMGDMQGENKGMLDALKFWKN